MADTHAVERGPFRAAPVSCPAIPAPRPVTPASSTAPTTVTWSTSTLRVAPETGLRALHGHG